MPRFVLVMLVICLTRATAAAAPDLHAQYLLDRKAAEQTPSMKGKYIDPCDPPGKERRWWKPLATPELDEARAELERYRNVLSCKSIKTDHVPGAALENEWHAAMKRGDAAGAKRAAQQLHASALGVKIDRAFVKRRLRAMARFRTNDKIAAKARPAIAARLADAERELAAGRVGSANLILNFLSVEVMDHFEP